MDKVINYIPKALYLVLDDDIHSFLHPFLCHNAPHAFHFFIPHHSHLQFLIMISTGHSANSGSDFTLE